MTAHEQFSIFSDAILSFLAEVIAYSPLRRIGQLRWWACCRLAEIHQRDKERFLKRLDNTK